MKAIFLILCIISIVIAQTPSLLIKTKNTTKPFQTEKFSGLWYEVARTYNNFEENCVAATVEYTMTDDLEYKVHNRCFDTKIGANLIEYNGTAKIISKNNTSYISKTYFWIFTNTYKIIYLDDDYSSAVMVSDDMKNVWVMNREPLMNKIKLNEIVSLLSQYIDTSKLIYTPQDSKGRYK